MSAKDRRKADADGPAWTDKRIAEALAGARGAPVDLFRNGAIPNGEMYFGARGLAGWRHKVRSDIAGAHPKAKKA